MTKRRRNLKPAPKIKTIKQASAANRGKGLEDQIKAANEAYMVRGQAQINFIATPAKKIDGEMVYTEKSTVDFVGLCHGRGIAFDTKSTKRDKLPLSNVKEHQVEFLRRWRDQGGLSFFIIEFAAHHEIYCVPLSFFEKYWDRALEGGKKYIPIEDIRFTYESVKPGRGLAVDYLPYCVN